MNTLQRVCTMIIVSFALAACTPLGQTFNDDSNYNDGSNYNGGSPYSARSHYDDFWVVSYQFEYNLGDNFNRNKDLRVFVSSQGLVEPVPIKQVDISLITDPDFTNPNLINMFSNNSYNDTYRLSSNVRTGKKIVVVTYGENTAEYTIKVFDPMGVDPGGSGSGSGIGIYWR